MKAKFTFFIEPLGKVVDYSSVGYYKLSDPLTIEVRFEVSVMFSQFNYELHGIEDRKIVKIGDTLYISYAVYDAVNALEPYIFSKYLINRKKKGLLLPQISYQHLLFAEFKYSFK